MARHVVLITVAAWSVMLALLVVPAATAGQAAPVRPPPRPEPNPDVGVVTPFRDRAFGGTSFEAASLEQADCPLSVSVQSLTRGERGVTLSLRLVNGADRTLTRQIVGAWVLVPDGTVRGYQRYEGKRSIAPGGSRSLDVTIRTTTVFPGDAIVVAVQETVGGRPWRRDVKALEKDVRAVLLP